MFSNFIYLIIVLLIYTTYQIPEKPAFSLIDTSVLFILLTIFFAFTTWFQFRRIKNQLNNFPFHRIDHRFNAVLHRQSIMAIVLFAINIYGLNLPSYVVKIPSFQHLPTIQALVFIALFIFYLSIVWYLANDLNRVLYGIDISGREYVVSNISFSVPILLPWLFLSGILDIIDILPFSALKNFLKTPQGEIIYFLFFLFFVAVLGPAMIQKFWRCRPLEFGVSRLRIENLCQRAGVEYANILYWPIFGGRMITAGVMGLVKRFRYILVTDALLQYLNPAEIDAVIAHEIGHVKKKHLYFYLFFFAGYILLSYAVFDLFIYFIIYTEPVFRFVGEITGPINGAAGINQATLISIGISLLSIFSFLFYFRYIFGYFMRNFERQADTFVYTLFNSAAPLISTFEKIVLSSGQPADKPNWHHFSIAERVDYLRKCEADREWIARHDRKIRKSMAIYAVGILIIGIIGYQINMGETGKKLNAHFFETVIERELEKHPDDARLYTALGDLYYHRNQYPETIAAYKTSLELNPENAHVLNNLAWLYATCEETGLRDEKQALMLALKAAAIEPASHVMDTLAESYYVNGKFEDAVEAGRKALELATGNRDYYEKQVKKFMEAAKKERL